MRCVCVVFIPALAEGDSAKGDERCAGESAESSAAFAAWRLHCCITFSGMKKDGNVIVSSFRVLYSGSSVRMASSG